MACAGFLVVNYTHPEKIDALFSGHPLSQLRVTRIAASASVDLGNLFFHPHRPENGAPA
jgi:hypothetical protein